MRSLGPPRYSGGSRRRSSTAVTEGRLVLEHPASSVTRESWSGSRLTWFMVADVGHPKSRAWSSFGRRASRHSHDDLRWQTRSGARAEGSRSPKSPGPDGLARLASPSSSRQSNRRLRWMSASPPPRAARCPEADRRHGVSPWVEVRRASVGCALSGSRGTNRRPQAPWRCAPHRLDVHDALESSGGAPASSSSSARVRGFQK
jgi:hypothetical protein